MSINSKIVSSLEKCFLDNAVDDFCALTSEKIFKNQKYSFQFIYEAPKNANLTAKLRVESDINEYITIKEVVNIPSDMPVYSHSDEFVLRRDTGLYPDLIRPLKYNGVARCPHGCLKAFWITVEPKGEVTGNHKIELFLEKVKYDKGLISSGEVLASGTLELDIKDVALPETDMIFSQWFHADCLADYYNVPVFSDRHFEICRNFLQTARDGGRTMAILPLLTLPLDIRHHHYRTTVQLIDVYKTGDNYTFKYDNLDRWLDMLKEIGFEYYEVCPLFSQWGATATAKVMAYENGEYKRIFGWDTPALSPDYKNFLRQFLGAFIEHMKQRGEDKKCYFHISDEPEKEHLEQYKALKEMIADVIEGYEQIDALSTYDFYDQGIVTRPIPSIMEIKPFLENNVPDLLCYYCGGHCINISNCHFSMSLSRTRYLGVQMFKYNIKGFLNWGYNFYNNRWSYDHVDPYLSSSGELFSASGDTYMVYPAPDGTAYESNRYFALYEAFEDLRAMKYCASLYSFEETVRAIEDITGEILFDKCVCDSETMQKIRRTINDMIFDKLA